MTQSNGEVKLKPIVSDYDKQTYKFPDVRTALNVQREELEARVNAINDLRRGKDGLYGLYIPQKLRKRLLIHCEQEFDGLEWITNIDDSAESVANGFVGQRQAKLLGKNRKWDECARKYVGDFVFSRFCVHPETGEFLPGLQCSMHAEIIANFGTHKFPEYLRLAYRSNDKNKASLLSRAYYNPKGVEDYDFLKDKSVNLHVLALLIKNGLPADVTVFLSAPRDIFVMNGFG